MTKRIIRFSPESLNTVFLRSEDGEILLAENGRRIVIKQVVPEGFIPVRAYEYELQQNENKREIVLIDKRYKNQAVQEFKRLLRK